MTVATDPRIEIAPQQALVDEEIAIRVTGLEPEQLVTVRAEMLDDAGKAWKSHATFRASADGVVDVGAQAPLSGTYDEADPMGLIWSLAVDPGEGEFARFARAGLAPTTVTFTAEVDGQPVASAELERLWVAPEVTRTPVRERGLVATLFRPAGPGPHPVVIVLGGSGGGLDESQAALVASRGYAALALAYFGVEHLPDALIEIPLEYFETAIQWLRSQDDLQQDRLAVIGTSKGGELALLLGSTFPAITAIVAYVPSGIVHTGIGRGTADFDNSQSSWSHRSRPVPFAPRRIDEPVRQQMLSGEPFSMTPVYLTTLENPDVVETSSIAVERINGPVLLISGRDDQLWPSAVFSDLVMERFALHNFTHEYRHLSYEEVGHSIGFPYQPTTVRESRHPVRGIIFRSGGIPKPTARAQVDAWKQVQGFLDRHLRQPTS